ncbi:hypothetical protein [Methanoculleus sp. 10]|uniref:hypothetical protein n=1 Tax=Methanoculleus sp. 10 TaxID=430615 RepID=UPI0025E1E42B|nr:hypothetical protein [Methanoculleus sp. 10]
MEESFTLAEVIKKHVKPKKKEFLQYLTGDGRFERGITRSRAVNYYNKLIELAELPEITEPQALIPLNLIENQVLDLKTMLDYLGTYTKIRSIAGYSFEEWRAFLIQPKREAPEKVPPVTTEQVTAAYVATPDNLKLSLINPHSTLQAPSIYQMLLFQSLHELRLALS